MVAHMSPRDLKPGHWVDGFRIIRRIGQGYFGLVFEVEKEGQRFALKFASHREGSGDAAQTDARIEREIVCLYQLRHRHIVRIWGTGHWPNPRTGYRYIVLDLIEGYTLEQWAERTHPTLREVAVLFDKVFAALEHMHGRNIFHRDLNLRNIMVSKSGNEPVLIDFSAGDYAAAESLTNEALPPGTPRYRSPEAALFWEQHRHTPGARYVFKEADELYALGAVLYDVLTHVKPSEAYKGEPTNNPFILPASPFEVTQGGVPQALSDLAMNLMAREPGERPAHARDVRRVLADLSKHADPVWQTPFHPAAAQVPPAPTRAARARSALTHVAPMLGGHGWRPWLRLGGGLALAALLGLLAAKQTSLSGGLPSPSPTQKEMSPAVRPLENAPLPTVPQAPQTHQGGSPRALPLAELCALAIATASWLELGCAGVQLRPEPGLCPLESVRGMESLGWAPSDQGALFIVFDVNQPVPLPFNASFARTPEFYGVYKDGPVTGELAKTWGRSPMGTKLTGHLWTSGEQIFGHYLWAHVPGKGKIPICLELGDSGGPGIDKKEGSKPGAAIAPKAGSAYPTREWR